jgi:hypothetical protein
MEFTKLFLNAKRDITIIGTIPLSPKLENAGKFLADLLGLNDDLSITILYESDSECFQHSLLLDDKNTINRRSYSNLITHRNRISGPTKKRRGKKVKLGLFYEVMKKIDNENLRTNLNNRLKIRQFNLRMPINIIKVDNNLYYSVITNICPSLKDYIKLQSDDPFYETLNLYLSFILEKDKGGKYLSKPGEELIQLYDKEGYPRGIFPRASFYTTKFKRYSIWGFVFNRKGELLLHQRSQKTKDGRGLWDKSTGGHVSLRDYSTFRTAQRELIEELFLPEAEFSKYMQAYLKDIINFGDWNLNKKDENSFKDSFRALDQDDWILFRATDEDGEPLTVARESLRRMHDDHGNVSFSRTMFISDVFLFIAPYGYIETEEQMKRTFELSEKRGAAQSHKLITVDGLRDWIEKERMNNSHLETFTDDLLHINTEYRFLLERFSNFIKFIFEGNKSLYE